MPSVCQDYGLSGCQNFRLLYALQMLVKAADILHLPNGAEFVSIMWILCAAPSA